MVHKLKKMRFNPNQLYLHDETRISIEQHKNIHVTAKRDKRSATSLVSAECGRLIMVVRSTNVVVGLNRIFTVDESGFSCVQNPTSVSELYGSRSGCECPKYWVITHHSVTMVPCQYLCFLKSTVDEWRFVHLTQKFHVTFAFRTRHNANDKVRIILLCNSLNSAAHL
jgi:hypothetical protein